MILFQVTRTRVLLAVLALLCVALVVDVPTIRLAADWPPLVVATAKVLTGLGDSGWMAIVLLVLSFAAGVLRQTGDTAQLRAQAALFLNLCVVLFVIILLSGLAAQVLKHLIGRPRPVHLENFGAFLSYPLSFGTSFNSFPSGHSTTFGAVGLFAAWMFPRRVPIIAAVVVVLALTRFVVHMHYLSDIVAGLTLGALCAAAIVRSMLAARLIPPRTSVELAALGVTLKGLLRKAMDGLRPRAARPDLRVLRLTLAALGLTLAVLAVFLAMPWLDLWVSGLFWTPDHGFFLTQNETLKILRDVYLSAIFAVLLTALVMLGLHFRLGAALLITPRAIWSFVTLAIIIGPGLVANSLFKEHWGRARPAHIEAFGGTAQFTLPLEMSDQCQSNCAFVSGEGSGISMLALIIAILAWPWMRQRLALRLGLLIAVAAFGMALRVALGRHFLSDTVFAFLFMAMVALALYQALNLRAHLRHLSLSGLRHDLGVIGDYLRGDGPDKLATDLRVILVALWSVGATFARVFAGLFVDLRMPAWAAALPRALGRKAR